MVFLGVKKKIRTIFKWLIKSFKSDRLTIRQMFSFISDIFSKSQEAKDLIQFLWKAKLWFLIPFILVLLIFSFILIFAQSSGVAPFVYTLF